MSIDTRCAYDHNYCWSPELQYFSNNVTCADWICRICEDEGSTGISKESHRYNTKDDSGEYDQRTDKKKIRQQLRLNNENLLNKIEKEPDYWIESAKIQICEDVLKLVDPDLISHKELTEAVELRIDELIENLGRLNDGK